MFSLFLYYKDMSLGQSTSLFGNPELPALKRGGGTADLAQQDPIKKMNPGGGLFGQNPANSTPSSLFGGSTAASTPQTGGGSLFGGGQPGSLFGGQTATGATNQTNTTQTGSLFGAGTTPGQTGSMFGGGTSLFGGANTTSQPQTASILGGTTTPTASTQGGGLFGGTQAQPQPGGLFGGTSPAQPQAGGIFGATQTSAQPQSGLFGASQTTAQPQAGGLFGGTTPAQPQAGLFGATQTSAQPQTGLFGATQTPAQPQAGSLFGGQAQTQAQPSLTSTLFGGSAPTGTTLFGALSSPNKPAPQQASPFAPLLSIGQSLVKTVIENQYGWRREYIEKLPDPFKNVCFQIQTQIDENEKYLSDISQILSLTTENRIISRAKAGLLVSSTKKVEAKLVRMRRTLDAISKYQKTVYDYTRDFVRICERISTADPFLSAQYPAPFLSEMLSSCEDKLSGLEMIINELEEILVSEKESSYGNFATLVSSLQMMHERFQLVCALTAQIHIRISRCQEHYIDKRRELGLLDETEIIESDARGERFEDLLSGRMRVNPDTNLIELFTGKLPESSSDKKPHLSALKNAISGRVGLMAQKLYK